MLLILFSCSTNDPQDTANLDGMSKTSVSLTDKTDPNTFATAKECGSCHPTEYSEWRESMHAYAIHSPVFQAMSQKAFRDSSGEVDDFCSSCHSPMGTLIGEGPNVPPSERSNIGKESVTCVTCHAAIAQEHPIGNLSLVWSLEDIVFGPFDDVSSDSHDSLQSDLLTSPQLCGSCHDVFNYPSLRIEEAYTEYATSPAYLENITCQDCHMSKTPGVPSDKIISPIAETSGNIYPAREMSSHRFVGPDYSLLDTFPYPDDLEKSAQAQQEQVLRIEELLQNAVMISDISTNNTEDSYSFSITLQSLTSGHNVPTGFTSERQLWIEVLVFSDENILFSSGTLDSNSDLYDEHSWDVVQNSNLLDNQLVNLQSKNLIRHGEVIDYAEIETTIFPFDADYIYKMSIPPLESRTYDYNFSSTDTPTRIEAKLRYRNLPPYVLRVLQLDEYTSKLKIFDIDSKNISWTTP